MGVRTVVSGVRELLCDGGAVRVDEHAELGLASMELSLEFGATLQGDGESATSGSRAKRVAVAASKRTV